MKIESKLLEKFVTKASLNGTIMAINLDFQEDKLRSSVRCPSNVNLTITEMKNDAFTDYEPIGEIFIKNTDMFIKYLKTFIGEIVLEKTEDYILKVYNKNRTGHIILGSELVCDNVWREELPKVDTTSEITLNKVDMKSVFTDVDLTKTMEIKINKTLENIEFEVGHIGESDSFITRLDIKTDGIGKTKIGNSFESFYKSIEGEFTLKIGTNTPILLEEKTDKIDFICYIAPMVGESDE